MSEVVNLCHLWHQNKILNNAIFVNFILKFNQKQHYLKILFGNASFAATPHNILSQVQRAYDHTAP